MKIIWRVAKTELQLLFLSPIAWILLIIFTIQTGMAFLTAFGDSVRLLVLYNQLWNITAQLFGGSEGLLAFVQSKLYLYIPLLTMGLMSREISTGTIKLLYSSPVNSRHIILGKFLSMAVYGLCLMLILCGFVFFAAFTIPHFDMAMVFTGLFGIFLLFCAYSAIGLFVSCLFSYQVAVAVFTMAILALLQYIGLTGQDIPLFRDITYWLSISGRTDEFINGLVTSEDLLYFIIVIILFLTFAIFKLNTDKQSNTRFATFLKFTSAIVIAVFIGYLSGRPALKCYRDNTATKTMTLSVQSQNILKKLKGGLTITTYVNLMDPQYSMRLITPKMVLQDMQQLKQYVRFKPETNLNYEFYYDESSSQAQNKVPLRQRAETAAEAYQVNFSLFKSPQQIRKEIDLSFQDYKLVRVLKNQNGKTAFLNFYNDLQVQPSEREISACINLLTGDAPTIGFIEGAGVRAPKGVLKQDYKYLATQPDYRFSLANQGFKILEIKNGQNIPADLNILVIADLHSPMSVVNFEHIQQFINNGGNLLIAGDISNQPFLNPLLKNLGVQLLPGSLVQQSQNNPPNLILGQFATHSTKVFPEVIDYAGEVVTMPGTLALSFDTLHGYHPSEILSTRKFGSWIKAKPVSLLANKVSFDKNEGDKAGTFPVAVTLTRKIRGKEQRIFVSGDADFLSNAELQGSRNEIVSANVPFCSSLFSWLSENKLPLKIERPIPPDRTINFVYEKLGLLHCIMLGVIPGLMALVAIIILVARKRH